MSQMRMLKQLFLIPSSGYLSEIGWITSFKTKMPVDSNNNPLPWVTYGFIDFIAERLNKNINIFEYGSGNSTLWYAEKTYSVTSVEHDKNWFLKIKNEMPENVNIYYQALVYGGEYASFPSRLEKKFDIVIVDGRDRVNCVKNALYCLTDDGIIVLDDSERDAYGEGMVYLTNQGFKKIDFWGISPGLYYKKCTTVFYKQNNCLDL